jgi:hypothetical protein
MQGACNAAFRRINFLTVSLQILTVAAAVFNAGLCYQTNVHEIHFNEAGSFQKLRSPGEKVHNVISRIKCIIFNISR